MGAAVAYFLARRGVAVTVVERSGVACAASGKSGGFLALDWCDSIAGRARSRARASRSTPSWPRELGSGLRLPPHGHLHAGRARDGRGWRAATACPRRAGSTAPPSWRARSARPRRRPRSTRPASPSALIDAARARGAELRDRRRRGAWPRAAARRAASRWTARRSRPTRSSSRWARGRGASTGLAPAARPRAQGLQRDAGRRRTCRRTRSSSTTAPPTAARSSPRSSRGPTATSTCAAWPIRRRCRSPPEGVEVSEAALRRPGPRRRARVRRAGRRAHHAPPGLLPPGRRRRPAADRPRAGRGGRLRGDRPRPLGHAERARRPAWRWPSSSPTAPPRRSTSRPVRPRPAARRPAVYP